MAPPPPVVFDNNTLLPADELRFLPDPRDRLSSSSLPDDRGGDRWGMGRRREEDAVVVVAVAVVVVVVFVPFDRDEFTRRIDVDDDVRR